MLRSTHVPRAFSFRSLTPRLFSVAEEQPRKLDADAPMETSANAAGCAGDVARSVAAAEREGSAVKRLRSLSRTDRSSVPGRSGRCWPANVQRNCCGSAGCSWSCPASRTLCSDVAGQRSVRPRRSAGEPPETVSWWWTMRRWKMARTPPNCSLTGERCSSAVAMSDVRLRRFAMTEWHSSDDPGSASTIRYALIVRVSVASRLSPGDLSN